MELNPQPTKEISNTNILTI